MKVISYSLYGGNPKYTIGMEHNIKLAKKYFPEWQVRVYMPSGNEVFKNKFESIGAQVILCGELTIDPMYFRLFVHDDETIEKYIIRDADDRLSDNDRACVDEWEESKYPFHICRTNPAHDTEIMGGLWGCVRKELDIKMRHEIIDYFRVNKIPSVLVDQFFLKRMVWPKIKGRVLVHGFDFNFKSGFVKPFPKSHLLGGVYEAHMETWEDGYVKKT